MRKVPIRYILAALIIPLAWFFNRNNSSELTENKSIINRIDQLVYTKHGKCRMECRQITADEIREIVLNGTVNHQKSNPADKPCPTVAYEGISTRDRQHIRVVLADCGDQLKVVTVIDLKQDHSCDCR